MILPHDSNLTRILNHALLQSEEHGALGYSALNEELSLVRWASVIAEPSMPEYTPHSFQRRQPSKMKIDSGLGLVINHDDPQIFPWPIPVTGFTVIDTLYDYCQIYARKDDYGWLCLGDERAAGLKLLPDC